MIRLVHFGSLCALVLFAVPAISAEPAIPATIDPKADGPTIYQTVCIQCHGPQGQGNEALKAPSIAGRPAWYVIQQLGNFREGRRGHNPQDVPGTLMTSIARLLHPENLAKVADTVEKMPLVVPTAQTALKQPDLEEGRLLFSERCMECHRFNATGEMTFGSPPLIGLQDWYLLAQIEKFKSGWRGAHPKDVYGAKMVISAQFIESEQAKHDVVAFILSLNPAGDAKKEHDDLFKQGTTTATKDKTLGLSAKGSGGARSE